MFKIELGIKKNIVVFDFETTGFSPFNDEVTEVGLVALDGNTFEVIATFNSLIKIENKIPAKVVELTGITNEMCDKYGVEKEVVGNFLKEIMEDAIVVAHNAAFDLSFLEHHFNIEPRYFYDTLCLSRLSEPSKSHKLGDICDRRGINLNGAHRALNDVIATKELLYQLLNEKDLKKHINTLSSKNLRYRPKYLAKVV